ncbi:MAG: class I SAM-dependent methyltransferase, partial [Halocynthiibacter sp.]
AAQNARALGLSGRVQLRRSDWFDDLGAADPFDMIVSNPPYVSAAEMATLSPELAWEPEAALCPGGDGLHAYRIICAGSRAHLAPRGWLMVEIGPTQANGVMAMIGAAGFVNLSISRDLDGRDRVISAQSP